MVDTLSCLNTKFYLVVSQVELSLSIRKSCGLEVMRGWAVPLVLRDQHIINGFPEPFVILMYCRQWWTRFAEYAWHYILRAVTIQSWIAPCLPSVVLRETVLYIMHQMYILFVRANGSWRKEKCLQRTIQTALRLRGPQYCRFAGRRFKGWPHLKSVHVRNSFYFITIGTISQ